MSDPVDILKANLERVRSAMADACGRAGRDPAGVTLVAVTKTVDAAVASLLPPLGVAALGENRVQEGERKHAAIGDAAAWHMIGHLQRNKVRKALRVFRLIHAVDSLRLAEALSAGAVERGAPAEVLVEVNVSGEDAKYGFAPADAAAAVPRIAALPGLRLTGLMTMAPFVDDPETVRPVFAGLRALRDRLNDGHPGLALRHLSMGMTQDYAVAIEEGATLVRIGTALFRGLERGAGR